MIIICSQFQVQFTIFGISVGAAFFSFDPDVFKKKAIGGTFKKNLVKCGVEVSVKL